MAVGESASGRKPLSRASGRREAGPRTPALRFAVLGPVRVRLGDQELPAGSPQLRALLATVLLRGGRTATAGELVDAIWGEEPPQQALAALRTYAFRLRKALGSRAEVLASESGGYALRLSSGDELDIDRVAELTAEAEKHAAAGKPARAHELFGTALAEWDGDEALVGVPGPDAELQRTRLAEHRLRLCEQRLTAGLEAGLHAESVSELTALTTVHPLRERLRELLMLALYRCGRQAEALAVYSDARRILTEELGVEPRAELSELQQGILRADSDLAYTGDSPRQTLSVVRPAQLPAAVPDFTGRVPFVSELGEQLATAGGSIMAVSAVAGIGGVGKTTLAVQVAHAARGHFPDGQLYIDLQGAGTAPAEPEAVLGSFLRALGTADSAIPQGLNDRAALYRSLLDGRRILTLLDNARDAAQVRPLLPGTPGCAALITSRSRMVDLAGAHLLDLDVMGPEEALTLFTRIVGDERVRAERRAAMDVVAACGFLPLAIRIAAARLAARRTWTVSTLARKLSDEHRRLDELQAGDQAVKASFELGYSQLEPDQARAFRLLGLTESPDISLHAAAALLGHSVDTAEDLLESLVDTSLLESAAPGRYRQHDLVRLFARACAERDEQPPSECDAALNRLLDFYLATTATVYALERPGDRLTAHLCATSQPGMSFTDPKSARDWLFAEADSLLSVARQSASRGEHRRTVDTLLTAQDIAEAGGFARQFELAIEAVLDGSHLHRDTLSEGRARMVLAHVHSVAGRFDEADAEAQRAWLLSQTAEDPIVCGSAPNDRAIIALYQERYDDAEAYLDRALSAFRADGNRSSEASALSNLSRVHLETGRTESAVLLAERAHSLYQELGSTLRLANAKYALGLALGRCERYTEALDRLTQALATFQASRQRLWEGMTCFRLAEVRFASGAPAEAATLAEQALSELRETGGSWRRANILWLLGQALEEIRQAGRARACWEQALTIFEDLGSPKAAEVRNLLSSTSV